MSEGHRQARVFGGLEAAVSSLSPRAQRDYAFDAAGLGSSLPQGRTCGDCVHFDDCREQWLIRAGRDRCIFRISAFSLRDGL